MAGYWIALGGQWLEAMVEKKGRRPEHIWLTDISVIKLVNTDRIHAIG